MLVIWGVIWVMCVWGSGWGVDYFYGWVGILEVGGCMRLVYETITGDFLNCWLDKGWGLRWWLGIGSVGAAEFVDVEWVEDEEIEFLCDLINWYDVWFQNYFIDLWDEVEEEWSCSQIFVYAQNAEMVLLTSEWSGVKLVKGGGAVWFLLGVVGDWPVSYLFTGWYVVYIVYKLLVELMCLMGLKYIVWGQFLVLYLYSWIYNGVWKVESVEEVLCLIVLWPWCIFLVFTHLVMAADYVFMFGFAEWGLPVFYGLLLLVEHLWAFGVSLVAYLMGVRGRKLVVVTFIEDIIAVVIMISRVVLQAVRGLIVGMFHFICREVLLNLVSWWDNDFVSGAEFTSEMCRVRCWYDAMGLASDVLLAAGGLLVVVAIMFLQLTFLIISIWLFCKCWFISFRGGLAEIDDFQIIREFVRQEIELEFTGEMFDCTHLDM